jgi:hypothetical protein
MMWSGMRRMKGVWMRRVRCCDDAAVYEETCVYASIEAVSLERIVNSLVSRHDIPSSHNSLSHFLV